MSPSQAPGGMAVQYFESSYLLTWLSAPIWGVWRTNPAWLWRLSSQRGSKGVLGDVGVHLVDFGTYPAGPIKTVFARLKTFPKAPPNRMGAYKLDACLQSATTRQPVTL